MSFSNDIKTELETVQASSLCCRQALACGLLYDAETDGEARVLASYSTAGTAEFARKIFSSVYGKEAAPFPPVASAAKCCDVAVTSEAAASDVGNGHRDVCAECLSHFLRGLIIASGSVTDPASQYHFEILLSHPERAPFLSDVFADGFARPIIVNRRAGTGIVIKNSEVIENILMTAGANNSYFEFLNKKIERDLRAGANRAANCMTKNIARSVSAAEPQFRAIETLKAAGELEKLPEELRETAQMRMLYPDLPLSELAARHCPPITKSGVNHRIKKIIEAAEKLSRR